MKQIRMLFVATIATVFVILIQIAVSQYFKVDFYTYYLETYFVNGKFKMIFDYKNIILLIIVAWLVIFLLLIKNKFRRIGIIILIMLFAFNAYTLVSLNQIPIHLTNSTQNSIIIGKGNPLKITFYVRFTCKDCGALNHEITSVVKEYIDSRKVELNIKLVDANSIFSIENLNHTTYTEYTNLYLKSHEIKMMDLTAIKQKYQEKEYQERLDMVSKNQEEAKALKVHWVPTFYINNKKYEGHYTKQEFKKIIEGELKNAKIN